jgi:hypothetical protein
MEELPMWNQQQHINNESTATGFCVAGVPNWPTTPALFERRPATLIRLATQTKADCSSLETLNPTQDLPSYFNATNVRSSVSRTTVLQDIRKPMVESSRTSVTNVLSRLLKDAS